jgi:hypothetical protein
MLRRGVSKTGSSWTQTSTSAHCSTSSVPFSWDRRTFEGMTGAGGGQPGVQAIVFSQTLRQQDYPNIIIVYERPEEALADLRSKLG